MEPIIFPAAIYLIGAALIPFFKGRAKKVFIISVPLAALVNILFIKPQTGWIFPFLDFYIILLHADRLSLFMGYIFAFIGFLIILYSIHVKENEHHIFSFLFIGSSLGVVFAGDFLTFFIFWEMMAVTATVLILLQRDVRSMGAGFRYLIMHLIGGGILLMGILLHFSATGSMEIAGLTGVPFALILTGVGFKAAFIPLHTWLPDAYPKASFTVSVLLCVFTTKVAVYALARVSQGPIEWVAYMGGLMALYGVTFALLQSDARKLLSYLIISSVGFMVAGVGIGTQMGIDGGLSHVWNGILYKSLMFMCIGAVIYRTGKHDLTELGGLARKMPITTIACIIAALSISGVPLFNGFVSKAMIYEAVYYESGVLYLMLKLASVGTFLVFCKFIYFGFLIKKEVEAREAPLTMTIPMIIVASLCILGGIYPNLITNILPYQTELHVYSWEKIMGVVQLLVVTGAIFLFGKKLFAPHKREILDFDYFYIKLAGGFIWFCKSPVSVFANWVNLAYAKVARISVRAFRYLYILPVHWVDRLSMAAEKAVKRVKEREERIERGEIEVDVKSIDFALFLAAVMLLIFLMYMALVHLL